MRLLVAPLIVTGLLGMVVYQIVALIRVVENVSWFGALWRFLLTMITACVLVGGLSLLIVWSLMGWQS